VKIRANYMLFLIVGENGKKNDKSRNQETEMISRALKNERIGIEMNAVSISYMLCNTGQKILSVKEGVIRDERLAR
jgi:hypothetical protein